MRKLFFGILLVSLLVNQSFASKPQYKMVYGQLALAEVDSSKTDVVIIVEKDTIVVIHEARSFVSKEKATYILHQLDSTNATFVTLTTLDTVYVGQIASMNYQEWVSIRKKGYFLIKFATWKNRTYAQIIQAFLEP